MSSVHKKYYRDTLDLLRLARIERGLSQTEVAYRLRRPQSYVSKVESGERRLDIVELWEFAEVYGVTLSELTPWARLPDREGEAKRRR